MVRGILSLLMNSNESGDTVYIPEEMQYNSASMNSSTVYILSMVQCELKVVRLKSKRIFPKNS